MDEQSSTAWLRYQVWSVTSGLQDLEGPNNFPYVHLLHEVSNP